jgi:hypothetical protein
MTQAAIYEEIDKPLNDSFETGPAGVWIRDSELLLDAHRLRHVVIRESPVEYRGGPINLLGVYFVKCTFSVSDNRNGQIFASTLLASSEVNLDLKAQ